MVNVFTVDYRWIQQGMKCIMADLIATKQSAWASGSTFAHHAIGKYMGIRMMALIYTLNSKGRYVGKKYPPENNL